MTILRLRHQQRHYNLSRYCWPYYLEAAVVSAFIAFSALGIRDLLLTFIRN